MENPAYSQMHMMLKQAEQQAETIRNAMLNSGVPVPPNRLEARLTEIEKMLAAKPEFRPAQIAPEGAAVPVTTQPAPQTPEPTKPSAAPPFWMLAADALARSWFSPAECEWLSKHVAEGTPGAIQFAQSECIKPIAKTLFATYKDFLEGKIK